MKKPVAFATLASLALLGFGCTSPSRMLSDKIAEKATEGYINSQLGGEGKVNLDDNTVTYEGKDGSVSYGEGAKLPSDFPSDVPMYAGAKISMASSNKQNGGTISVMAQSSDSLSKVSAWYDTKLDAEGWKKEDETTMTGAWYRTYSKSARRLTVSLSGSDSGTMITLAVENE